MRKVVGVGCLVVVLLGVAAAWLMIRSDLGKFIIGFAMMMVGMAARHDANYEERQGVAVSVGSRDAARAVPLIRATISYTASDGVERRASRFLPSPSSRFDSLEAGDTLVVYVCRTDPTIIKLGIEETTECDRKALAERKKPPAEAPASAGERR